MQETQDTDTIKIEKGIPIPATYKKGLASKTLKDMCIGDSVVIPKEKVPGWRSAAVVCLVKVKYVKISATECRLWRVG